MNTVKRRWPDLLIGLLVLLLLGGFAALLLGRGTGNRNAGSQAAPVQEAGQTPATQTPATPTIQTPTTQTPTTQTPTTQPGTPAAGTQTGSQTAPIPTIPAASVPDAGTAQSGVTPPDTALPGDPQTSTAQPPTVPGTTVTDPATTAAPRVGGAVATTEVRTPTRNDYRISLGSYASSAAVREATAGVGKLGYTVYPIAIASGTVAQVGPFASREAAAQALADIHRALPGALLYPPRNAPASETGTTAAPSTTPAQTPATQTPAAQTPATQTPAAQTGTSAPSSPATAPAASGPVYLQVGAYNSTAAAQTTVGRVRDLGLEPSVNAPAGKLVTVLVGPFQGQALVAAEAKLRASGVDSFRVR